MFNHAKRMMSVGACRIGWLVGLCAMGAGCSEVGLHVGDPNAGMGGGAGRQGWQTFPDSGNSKIDLLFAVDNGRDIAPLQAKMLSQLPAMIDVLQSSPNGPPDLHVAVVSSNTGVGKFDLPEYDCWYAGDRGVFQAYPRGACVVPPLVTGQTYFQSSSAGANFSGNLADQIACVGNLGDQGCGFAGPFKSIRWSLDPVAVVTENAGFLRPEALLAIVLFSTKDDCSVSDESDLGDPTQMSMSDPLGPFTRFRCNEFGHLCHINGAMTHPPRGAATDLQGCVSNESSPHGVTSVGDEVAFLHGLKSNPTRVVAAAITGPTTPYSIDMVQDVGATELHPHVDPSCQSTSGDYGEPAVRVQQWASGLGGTTYPICGDSFAPALQAIGQTIVDRAGASCFAGPFTARTDGVDQPNCRVADLATGAPVGAAGEIILNCADNGGVGSCWTAVDDAVDCSSGTKSLVIKRVTPAPTSSYVGITCSPCTHVELGCGAV